MNMTAMDKLSATMVTAATATSMVLDRKKLTGTLCR